MFCNKRMVILSFLMIWTFVRAHAQTRISGKISDATGPLQGATVRLSSTPIAGTSDLYGIFGIVVKNPGQYQLTVSYIGYQEKILPISIKSEDEINLGEIVLTAETKKNLDEIVVTGVYKPSQIRALQMKKASSNIVETLAADAIGKLPDRNAAEAVQRIQGVSIERDMGEGRFVSVRGTPIQWSSSTLNGNRLPSASGDYSHRGLQMDIFPSELIQFVKMAKAITPDMDGDAIGGSIDFITRSAVQRETFSVNGSGGYVDQSRKPSYNGSIVYGNKITDKLSFITTAVIWDRSSAVDNYQMIFDFNNPDPKQSFGINRLEFRDYVARRRTIGFNGALNYKINESNLIYFKGLFSQYLDQQTVRETYFNINQKNVLLQARHADYLTDLYNIQLGGSSKISERLNADWSIYNARSSFKFNSPKGMEANDRGYPVVNFVAPMNYGKLAADGKRYQYMDWIDGAPNDRAVLPYTESDIHSAPFNLNQVMLLQNRNSDRDYVAKLDLTFSQKDNLTWKGGIKTLNKRKQALSRTLVWMPGASSVIPMNGLNREEFPYNGGFLSELGNPYDHVIVDQVTNEQIDKLYQSAFQGEQGVVQAQGVNSASNIAGEYTGHENIYAGYIMGNWRINDDLEISAGLRNEYNHIIFKGYKAITDKSGVSKNEIEHVNKYNMLLPGVHGKWSISDNSILRGALTRSFARPDFNSLNPGTVISEINNTITEGNTALKPTVSNNFDLMFEHYFNDVGIISAGAFYKDIHNFIYDNQSLISINQKNYIKLSPENLDKAHLLGFEVGLSKRFSELKGFLSRFGVEVNYSFVDSKMDLPKYEKGVQVDVIRTTLPKQAKNIFNTILFYEDGHVMMRLAGNYKGRYLNAIRSQAGPQHYQWFDKNFTLDFSGSYALKKNIRLFIEMNNITNEPNRFYHGDRNRIENLSYVSFRGQVGVSMTLK